MKKIEAPTLEEAYALAASHYNCSVTQLEILVIQHEKKGAMGLFGRQAVIVARRMDQPAEPDVEVPEPGFDEPEYEEPETLEEEEEAVADEAFGDDDYFEPDSDLEAIAAEVKEDINTLFETVCFSLDVIEVLPYDDHTLLIEFDGEDAALLIGKEGYRYKALSYMLFNWINAKYQVQLRLEIAEFLKNQEEAVSRYLSSVFDSIDRDGYAQTKVLDGVLVQIALQQLRDRYHDKYVAIRTTRDGGKYIIINDYHNY